MDLFNNKVISKVLEDIAEYQMSGSHVARISDVVFRRLHFFEVNNSSRLCPESREITCFGELNLSSLTQ